MKPPVPQHRLSDGVVLRGVAGTRPVHPLLGWRLVPHIHRGPVFDAVTGAVATRAALLSDPFHYPGDIHTVPGEILHWAYARTFDVAIAYREAEIVRTGAEIGFTYLDAGDGEGLVEQPLFPDDPDNRHRFEIYRGGTPLTDPPDDTHPHPSVFCLAMRDLDGVHGHPLSAPRFRIASPQTSTLTAGRVLSPGVITTGGVDSGIVIAPEVGPATFEVTYARITDQSTLSVSATVTLSDTLLGRPIYYQDHRIWGAPVAVAATDDDIRIQTLIDRTPLFETLYGDPANAAILDGIIADLTAGDSYTFKRGIPLGRERFFVSLPDYTGAYEVPITGEMRVTAQLPAYLPFELPSAA